MIFITDHFHHQLGLRHPKGTYHIAVTGLVGSRSVVIRSPGNLIAISHDFHDLKSYDFWLQMKIGAKWLDLIETVPYAQFKPDEYKGDHVPQGRQASKIYRLANLPIGAEIRAATSHLEGTNTGNHAGAWGVTLQVDRGT